MKTTFEKLWNEYFAAECAVIDTEKEKALLQKAAEMHKAMNGALTDGQNEILEKYIEVLYEIQSLSAQKAFFRGCEFTTSFFFETREFKQQ